MVGGDGMWRSWVGRRCEAAGESGEGWEACGQVLALRARGGCLTLGRRLAACACLSIHAAAG